jgi:hypothetical protein
MKALLICPVERPGAGFFAEAAPLAGMPLLGKELIAWWLEHLVTLGAKQVLILAADRPEQVRAIVGDGARWGLKIEVQPERSELTVAEAREKYRHVCATDWLPMPNDVLLMDCLPGGEQPSLFRDYAGWFGALREWWPIATKAQRAGMREIQPGVWAGRRTRVAASAQLRAPCWLGDNVWIGPRSVIGPMAVLEDRVVVEDAASVSNSFVGAETYLGELTELKDSLAWSHTLINWRTGSRVRVPDAFLMCSLSERKRRPHTGSVLGRLVAALVLLLTLPLGALLMLWAKLCRQPSLKSCVAVRPQASPNPSLVETFAYYELANARGWLAKWPQLWNIVRGDFAWVGNRPLSPSDVTQLTNDFERLWLAAPIGLVTLAHAEGTATAFGDEERACASFYAVQASWRLDLSILARALLPGVGGDAAQ